MIRTTRIAIVFGALGLTACQQQAAETADSKMAAGDAADVLTPPIPAASGSAEAEPAKTIASDANAGENDGSPDITPAPLSPEAAKTEKGARANLLAWARGIELREFDQAWNLMGDAAKAQTSRTAFNKLFAPLRNLTVSVPGGEMEGAAGSSYTVPTTVTGTRADGTKEKLEGDVVLRRVNDVDGAAPAQLRWHIEQVNLKPG